MSMAQQRLPTHSAGGRSGARTERLPRHGPRAAPRFDPPADDPLRMDPDQSRRQRNRLAAPTDLDPARTPRVCACQIVDHDRGSPGPGHVAELLRPFELAAADVDRVARGVVDPCDRDHVRGAVRADRRDPSELPPAGEVLKLGLPEDTHRHGGARRWTRAPDACGWTVRTAPTY